MTDEMLVFISAFATGDDGAIHAFRLKSDAPVLEPLCRTTDVENPFFLAQSPDGKTLYSIHEPGTFGDADPGQVAAYEILGRDGEVHLLNRQSTGGSGCCSLDVEPSGRAVLVANYSSGSVAALPVRPDGSLGESAGPALHEGSSINPVRQTGPRAHCFAPSPDGRFAFAADLGIDKVMNYRLDAETAALKPNRQAFARTLAGAGPRHITFHPNGQTLYVINELHNSVTAFDYEPETGTVFELQTLSTLPEEFNDTSHCADVKVTPDGKFLYGTNRGHDSIAAYAVGKNGRLTLIAIEPCLGEGPQNLAITPDGRLLLCANMPGNNIVVFRIDPETGRLTPAAEPVTMPMPSCIRIL